MSQLLVADDLAVIPTSKNETNPRAAENLVIPAINIKKTGLIADNASIFREIEAIMGGRDALEPGSTRGI